jgi:glycosyltransferase involved in cell wall biosynthesis
MYDYLFITHLPSFYKVNLYNQLAKRLKIYVIFLASSSAIRTDDFIGRDIGFEHAILHRGNFESRPKIYNIAKLLKILFRIQFRTAVVSGWDLGEFWITALINNKARNALVVESTITESSTTGLKLIAKKYFVSRISTAFPSGQLHQQLLETLGFNGASYLTKSVGIFDRQIHAKKTREFASSFLYVGRLSHEKNLLLLVEAFNDLPHFKLSIVGSGPLEGELKQIAHENITFSAHVPNKEISSIYLTHDVLILPSLSEPWGVVVDEALYYGLPVIVSTHVGCHTELVIEGETGFKFDPHNKRNLIEVIQRVSVPEIYRQMQKKVEAIDFNERDEQQLMAYLLGCQRECRG